MVINHFQTGMILQVQRKNAQNTWMSQEVSKRLVNGLYNPFTNRLLTSWDIQVGSSHFELFSRVWLQFHSSLLEVSDGYLILFELWVFRHPGVFQRRGNVLRETEQLQKNVKNLWFYAESYSLLYMTEYSSMSKYYILIAG